jgi:hypothetical protein
MGCAREVRERASGFRGNPVGDSVSNLTIHCSKCWRKVEIEPVVAIVAVCPACSTSFSEPEVEEIQANIAAGRVAVVNAFDAARMLGHSGDPEWAMRELRDGVILLNGSHFIRLPLIRAYADNNRVQLSRATAGATVWAKAGD